MSSTHQDEQVWKLEGKAIGAGAVSGLIAGVVAGVFLTGEPVLEPAAGVVDAASTVPEPFHPDRRIVAGLSAGSFRSEDCAPSGGQRGRVSLRVVMGDRTYSIDDQWYRRRPSV